MSRFANDSYARHAADSDLRRKGFKWSPPELSDYERARKNFESGRKIIYTSEQYDVQMAVNKQGRFAIRYGLQLKFNLSYGDAATQLGECLLHAMTCAGRID